MPYLLYCPLTSAKVLDSSFLKASTLLFASSGNYPRALYRYDSDAFVSGSVCESETPSRCNAEAKELYIALHVRDVVDVRQTIRAHDNSNIAGRDSAKLGARRNAQYRKRHNSNFTHIEFELQKNSASHQQRV